MLIISRLIPGTKGRNVFLACASIVFYAFGQLQYVPLFLGSVVLNYASGILLARLRKGRKAVLAVSVALNLALLCVFKYTDFFISNLNSAFGLSLRATGILLPIGISFYTFQGMSYVIDVYRDSSSVSGSFIKLLLYISFFPQLIAGPIVKYHDVSAQIDSRQVTPEDTADGIRRFSRGLAKKVLIANAVGKAADAVFDGCIFAGSVPDWRLAWLGAVCYTLQIYYDFSGYSDMAIGLGRMFGFRFLENFNYPYAAASIRDFWRRWHISLSTWFREYLYIPLGGNRLGKSRAVLNRFIVFLCTGFWHGANWTFIVWGLCHGFLSGLEGSGIIPAEKLGRSKAGKAAMRIYTLLSVTLLFAIFRSDSLAQGWAVISGMFSFVSAADAETVLRGIINPAFLSASIIAVLFAGNLPSMIKKKVLANCVWTEASENLLALLLLGLSALDLARGGFNPFIYFQF